MLTCELSVDCSYLQYAKVSYFVLSDGAAAAATHEYHSYTYCIDIRYIIYTLYSIL